MTEEKRTIRGVEVVFPCKPYPSQFSFMDKVIQGIEKRQNCLLESPTGSGKSLALLCSALAWQSAEYNKKRQEEISIENSKGSKCCCKQKQGVKIKDNTDMNVNHGLEEVKPIKPSHISISIIKGQIAHQQANVIVNTTSTSLQLNYGAVSQSLLCVGGPAIQKECNLKYPNGIQAGDVAETSGGNLKCDVIYHGALLPWKDSGSLQVLQAFIKNCMATANDRGYVSIAFPALGAGNLGYPRDVVARKMFSCVDDFAENYPTSSVIDVRFVVYSGDSNSVQIFEEMQRERQRGNQRWIENQADKKTTVTPDSKNTSTIVIPESDSDDEDDFKPTSKYRTPGGAAQAMGSNSKTRKHQSISYETSPPCEAGPSCMEDEEEETCTCGEENKPQSRKVPKIYFGTRTHKQISQIVRELKKTAYREARMTILASREHTCIHPEISKSRNKNEGCKELMDGPGCKFNDRVKKVFPHYSNLQEYGLSEAWDLEDLIGVCKKKKACPYFSVRSFRKEVDIIFCPYNYLIDPVIRQSMEINLKDQIVIVDEAHNIEDSARDGASDLFTDEQLDKACKEIHEMVVHNIKPVEHLRLKQMVEGFMKLIQNNMDQLEQKGFDQAAKVWSGYDIVVRMKEYGIGPQHVDQLGKCFAIVCEDMNEKTVKNMHGQTVKLSSATLSTLEHMFKIMDFMYRDNLKFVEDYRVAILKTTSYVSDKNTDGSWVNSRKRRGGMKNTPKFIITLHFWCMNPGVAFSDFNSTRCIVLTSGTLSPLNSFESELGSPFPIKLEANHVIEDKQVWVGAMSQGPTGKPLHAVFKTMETLEFQDELGRTVLQVCQEVPHGVLCFLPSYRSLDKFTERWKISGIYDKISQTKKIIQEPRRSDQVDFDELMKYFYDTIHGVNDEEDDIGEETTGALFLAVCRGKVSEGLDFADNFARAVITVGIPYPNWKDIQVEQKRLYNDKNRNAKGLLSGSEWYEIQAFRALNQALGRCIRHKKDWGLLILADERFVKNRDKYCKGLSKWVRNKVQGFTSCKQAIDSISRFAKDRIKDMPVINPDASFIPGTPITPGQNLGKQPNVNIAAAMVTPITPATPVHTFSRPSMETPSFPIFQTAKEKLFASIQQPEFSSPEPNKGQTISIDLTKTLEHPILTELVSFNHGNQIHVTTIQQPQNLEPGMVSLLSGNSPATTSTQNDLKSETVYNKPTTPSIIHQKGHQNLKQNKLFKYCTIPESGTQAKGSNNESHISEDQTKSYTNCPKTPTLFDTQDSEQQGLETDLAKQCGNSSDLDKNNYTGAEKDQIDHKSKYFNLNDVQNPNVTVNKKPIFRRRSVPPTITADDDSQDDFKDQSTKTQVTRRRSCDKKMLTEIQQNTKEEDNVDNRQQQIKDEEENESEEILKTRRKQRGTKRKSNSNLKSTKKKSKGVDFLDNIENKNEEAREHDIRCKNCGEILVSQLKDFERRKRHPNFLIVLTRQRNTEVLFFPLLDVQKTSLQVVSTKLKEDSDVMLNSYVDTTTGCVLQYLSCKTCMKDVIGIQVVTKGNNSKDVEEKQAWIISSHVDTIIGKS